MSPELPNAGEARQAIDAKQMKLDQHDGTADGRIEQKDESVDDQQKLTAVYIGRVNDLQGRISDVRRTVDIGKNTSSPTWQALERSCTETENGLLERLAKIDPDSMRALVEAFDKDVALLIEQFQGKSKELQDAVPDKFGEKPPSAVERLVSMGLPREGADLLAQAEVERHGDGRIAEVQRNMSMLLRIPVSTHRELFGCPPAKVGTESESKKIAKLLCKDSLEASPYAYLLEDPAAKVRLVLEVARDRGNRIQSEIDEKKGQEESVLKQMVADTKGSSYNYLDVDLSTKENKATLEVALAAALIGNYKLLTTALFGVKNNAAAEKGIELSVTMIKKIRERSKALTNEKQEVDGSVTMLDIALAVHSADEARDGGRSDEADRRMTQLLELQGENLGKIDADLAVKAMEAATRLKNSGQLSKTETALLFSDPRSPEALSAAIESKVKESKESGDIDVLDQVRAKQTFRAGSFISYKNAKNIMYEGRDVSGALRSNDLTTLQYTDGRTLRVLVSNQARRVLENLPAGKEPVLLRSISSMRTETVGSGRGANSRLLNAPNDFIIQHTDIGFVEKDGTVLRDDGKTKIDMSTFGNRAVIESQIRNQKGFLIEPYKAPMELRLMDGKPYPYGLNTIKTQSGLTVEGVTIAQDALPLINADPPEGNTLVLKRIPRRISLRTPDSAGKNRQPYQRVLDADMIQKKDLAYAKIDGENLQTTDVATGTTTEKSVNAIEKEQEEQTRGLERALDHHPGIRNVKSTASTIQQTVGHLQKFLEAKQSGSAREAFVTFAREEAKPTLDLLQNPELRRDLDEARDALQALKGVNGVALGGLEQKIDAQIKALDGFAAMLADGRTQHLLETILDASKFDADTWANFFTNELPVIVASIVVACAAAALVVATCGGGFILIAAATAAGGVIGSELGKEAVYYGHQLLDSRVRSGQATFKGRSRTGDYFGGDARQFNEETGTYEDRDFLRDVARPLAIEFGQAFTTTLLTMGIGNFAGAQLSKLLENTNIVGNLAKRSDIMKAIARKLTALNKTPEVLDKAAGLRQAIARALKELPKEVGEEFREEFQENALEKCLNQFDLALAANDALDGKFGLGNIAALGLAILKGMRIGKQTIHYEIEGKRTPQAIAAKAQAIRSEVEANGGIVTDLGKGVLSIRYPVEGEGGKVEYETVQVAPSEVEESMGLRENKQDTPKTEAMTRVPDVTVGEVTVDMKSRETLKGGGGGEEEGKISDEPNSDRINKNFDHEERSSIERVRNENAFRREMKDLMDKGGPKEFKKHVLDPERVKTWDTYQLMDISNRLRLSGESQAQVDLYEQSADPEFKAIPRVREFYAFALLKTHQTEKAIDVCRELAIEPGNSKSLVWGAIGDALTNKALSAEKFLAVLQDPNADEKSLQTSIKKYRQHFGENASLDPNDVEVQRKQSLERARVAYEQGFAEKPNSFNGISTQRRLLDQKADVMREISLLADMQKAGPLNPDQLKQLEGLQKDRATLTQKIADFQVLNRIAIKQEGGTDSREYWTYSSAIENEILSGASVSDITPLLQKAYADVDAPWKLENTWNRLNRVEQSLTAEMEAMKTLGEDPAVIATVQSKIEAMQEVKADLRTVQSLMQKQEALLLRLSQGPQQDNALEQLDEVETALQRKSSETPAQTAEEKFLQKSANTRGLLDSVTPQYIPGGLQRGGRVADIMVGRQDVRNFTAIIQGLDLQNIQDPREAIQKIQAFVRTTLDTAKVQDLQSPEHKDFDRTSDANIRLSGVNPGKNTEARTINNLSASLLAGLGDCREVAYANSLLFNTYQALQIHAMQTDALIAMNKGDTKEFKRLTDAIVEIQRYELRVADIQVFSPIHASGVYEISRQNEIDPTPNARPFSDGQTLTSHEASKGILIVRYADGTSAFIEKPGQKPDIPKKEGTEVVSIELQSLAENHTLTFLHVEGKKGKEGESDQPSTVEYLDGFYNQDFDEADAEVRFRSPYEFQSGPLDASEGDRQKGLIRKGSRPAIERDSDGNVVLENGQPKIIQVPVYIKFLRYSGTNHVRSLGETDQPNRLRITGRGISISGDPETDVQPLLDHARDPNSPLPLALELDAARQWFDRSNEAIPAETPRQSEKNFDANIELSKKSEAGRPTQEQISAVLEYMSRTNVSDAERCAIAAQLFAPDQLSDVQKDAVLESHRFGEGNLRDGYSLNERTVKGAKLMRGGVFTREQAALLLDTGICGNPPPPPKPNDPTQPQVSNQPRRLPNGIVAPPPPPVVVRKEGVASKPTHQNEVVRATEDERREYFKEKRTNNSWFRALGNTEKRSAVFSSNDTRSHIFWMTEAQPGVMSGVGGNSPTYKYLKSPEGSLEHTILIESEKMLAQAFANAKNIFPKDAETGNGFVVRNLGPSTSMNTGNVLGMGVDVENTDTLLLLLTQAKKSKDYSQVQKHLDWITSNFAHEMTHGVRVGMDDHPGLNSNEVPSHAVQFLSVWNKDQSFFNSRIAVLRGKPEQKIGRIHAEIGGLKLLQRLLIDEKNSKYKPKDFTPSELQRSIQSIPEDRRESVLRELTATIIQKPITDFEQDVRSIYDAFPR